MAMLLYMLVKVVPRGGIEPPTRGFSIHCSTPELPGHRDEKLMRSASGSGVLDAVGGGVQSEVDLKQTSSAVYVDLPV